jgi:hypothetical protein
MKDVIHTTTHTKTCSSCSGCHHAKDLPAPHSRAYTSHVLHANCRKLLILAASVLHTCCACILQQAQQLASRLIYDRRTQQRIQALCSAAVARRLFLPLRRTCACVVRCASAAAPCSSSCCRRMLTGRGSGRTAGRSAAAGRPSSPGSSSSSSSRGWPGRQAGQDIISAPQESSAKCAAATHQQAVQHVQLLGLHLVPSAASVSLHWSVAAPLKQTPPMHQQITCLPRTEAAQQVHWLSWYLEGHMLHHYTTILSWNFPPVPCAEGCLAVHTHPGAPQYQHYMHNPLS